MKKYISILGSTGSIGLTTLDIINKKKNYFKINLLCAHKNYKLISKQIKNYKPNFFIITNQNIYKKIKKKFKTNKVKILNNFKNTNLIKKSHITISAIPGIAGLQPTISLINSSKKILIANKESIICGWDLIKKKALLSKTKIVPVDSEHYSILRVLKKYKLSEIKKVYLTASGGPFLNYKVSQLRNIKPKNALQHPKWRMGKKISIDSSTLMNKILELIEAQKLFNLPNKKLDIIIHPNSLVHAIVDFNNGFKEFIYHETSMTIPLANAIFNGDLNIDDFFKSKKNNRLENLIFDKVNKKTFPIIQLKDRVNEYPSTPIIINASNEILVDQFLKKKIPFLSIYKFIKTILNDRNYKKYAIRKPKNIHQINEIDFWARETIKMKLKI